MTDPQNRLLNVMRFGGDRCVLAYDKKDVSSGKHYATVSRLKDNIPHSLRNYET